MEIRNYKQAINYLEGFIGKVIFRVNKEFLKKHDPLERMRIMLSLLGNPQDKFKSVLVGGTSGKGSTSYLISHILTKAGYKTGFTLSPHLQKVNERLQINGESISDKEFTKITVSMIRIIEAMKKMEIGAPSYFEIIVGMAFKYFVDQKVDIAVVEVGMGGEFDATNTLNPLIAVLTNVSLDHTSILGKTVEKIARTKAGIIKKNVIVVSGVEQPSVIKIVEEKCREVGAKLYRLHKDFELTNLKVSLLGEYQKENASLAIETVKQLKNFGFEVSEKVIKKSLKTAFFPGRFEIIPSKEIKKLSNKVIKRKALNYPIVLDGAHNPIKMKEFLKNLKKLFPTERKVFIVGFKFDKDIKKMLQEILGVADEVIVTQFKAKTDTNLHASADASDLKTKILKLRPDTKVSIEKDSKKALDKALAMQHFSNKTIIVVTGSLYLVGEIRNML